MNGRKVDVVLISIRAWEAITVWDLFGDLFVWAVSVLVVGFVLGFVCGRHVRRRRG